MSQAFKENLLALVKNGIPGERSHLEMLPVNRPVSSVSLNSLQTNPRISGVAVLLFTQNNEIQIALIKRQEYNGAHSGQISFPGGKLEEHDKDPEAAARRECFEEIGVNLESTDYIGALTKVYIPVSNFLMYPHLYFIDYLPDFMIDYKEVASIFIIKLGDILNGSHLHKENINVGNEQIYKNIPCFKIENEIIWGATALVLNELRYILNNY